ncbi:F-box family protein, partial [Trifolium medium]|nr:F-box family protein [Trifolium medium]
MVVASCYDLNQERSIVRILSLDDNVWRDIESFPVVPLHLDNAVVQSYPCVGVYVSDTLN